MLGFRFIRFYPASFMREMITVKEVCLALLAATFALAPAFAFEDAVHLQNSGPISAE